MHHENDKTSNRMTIKYMPDDKIKTANIKINNN